MCWCCKQIPELGTDIKWKRTWADEEKRTEKQNIDSLCAFIGCHCVSAPFPWPDGTDHGIGRTTGSRWVLLPLYPEDSGKEICIWITTLLFPDHAVLFSYIALAMLLAAPVPLLQFIKSQFSIKWYRLVGMVLLVLQFTGIADFRQTLTISHAMIGLSALVISGIVILEDTRTGGDEKKRISLLWVMLCAAGVIYTLAAFLFYVVAMGILSIRDLNNLKLVNDTRGHEAGDSLIYHFAEILKRTVPDGVFVGRYGGDEFIVIAEPAGEEDIICLLEKLSQAVETYNNSADTVSISYAAGYGHTSEFAEPTLQQLLEKADSDMYRKKKRYHYEQRKNM